MAAYLQKAKELLGSFSSYTICQIPRSQNTEADALSRLALMKDTDQLKVIPVEFLNSPSIQIIKEPQTLNYATTKESWITPIIQYLKDDVLPEDKRKVRLLRLTTALHTMYDD